MSIEVIKKQIAIFLETDKPEVLAIKGSWGVGKTFTWNKYLLEAKKNSKIALSRYAYASLFGINSLSALKYSLFENVVDKKLIGTEPSIDSFKKNTADLLSSLGRKSVKLARGSSLLKDFTPAIESISFLSLDKTIICIDDLERKGSGLSIKDTLGLISLLKEQKNCKVVILLNDGEEGLQDYRKYREKVIDKELSFSPTPKESAEIAFSESPLEIGTLNLLTTNLEITNIRVLKKIESLIIESQKYTSNFEDELKYQVIHSVVLFSWCFFCRGDGVPNLDYVINNNPYLSDRKEGEEETEESRKIKKWNVILRDYGYSSTDDLNLTLAETVKSGFYNESEFLKDANKRNNEILASKAQDSFSKAWKTYHDSFDNNQEEVIDTLYKSFKENASHITPVNMSGTVRLFKELGEEEKAIELIEFYVEKRQNEKEIFDMREVNTFGDINDEDIVSRFNAAYERSIVKEPLLNLLDRVARNNGWGHDDEVRLATTTVDEYYDFFKNTRGQPLGVYINKCLRFGQFSNGSDQMNEISNRVTQALIRIAKESKINERRLLRYGIEVSAENA